MQNNIKGVFFVPMREQINTNGILPSAPKGLKTCRGNVIINIKNYYQRVLILFDHDYAQK